MLDVGSHGQKRRSSAALQDAPRVHGPRYFRQVLECGATAPLLLLLYSSLVWSCTVAAAADDRTAIAVEALLRLETTNLTENPKLATAVTNLLTKTRGTPNFVKLVRKFNLTNQTEGLVEVAVQNPASESSVEAAQLLLAGGNSAVLRQTLEGTNVAIAIKAAEVLGNTGKKEAVPLLVPLLTDLTRDVALRKQAVKALANTEEGATAILQLAQNEKLPEDLRFTASTELSRVRWNSIKLEAAKVLPPLEGQNAQPLPPLADLLKMTGDPANGAKVFNDPSVACANCHRVKGQGIELGPDLSEIGSKLGKDALYESILDPSAGISFGYEAWQLTLKNGDEAFGIIASETADEITIKNATGIVSRYKKNEIAKREQMKLSIMPAGLQQAMSVKDLIDLVEYLAGLKKLGN